MVARWELGFRGMGEDVRGLKSTSRQVPNSHRDVKQSIGNGVAKEYARLMDMSNSVRITCGSGGSGWKEAKGENWDNCNSIINKNKYDHLCPCQVAQLVGMSPGTPEWLWVKFSVRAHTSVVGSISVACVWEPSNQFFSHLSLSLKSINISLGEKLYIIKFYLFSFKIYIFLYI